MAAVGPLWIWLPLIVILFVAVLPFGNIDYHLLSKTVLQVPNYMARAQVAQAWRDLAVSV
jgi:hypothetical protein